ncbi:MAG TPA: PxKF domain-containing protein [Pyrinomonadaceae bacterium]
MALPPSATAAEVPFALKAGALFPALMLQTTTSIETFADAAHNTQTSDYELGDTVYVKASVPGGILARRRVVFVDPAGFIRQVSDVTLPLQEVEFVIPTTQTTVVGGFTLNNIGTWRASIISSRGALVTASSFKVADPNNAIADLSVDASVSPANSQVPAGFDGTFDITVANTGPSNAQAAVLSVAVPTNTTFVSMIQTSGPTFTCAAPDNGVVKCTLAIFAKSTGASFIFKYMVNAGTPAGTIIAGTATIASTAIADDPQTNDTDETSPATAELNDIDNTSTARAAVVAGGGATCSLDCPEDIIVNANTTDNGQPDGQPGRYVSFGGASPNGDCGSLTASPTSGSFFPVGSTTVTVTSGLGGGSCTFTVTVVGNSPVSISCPANKTVTAPDGSCEATVDPGTPTTTPSGLPVEGVRNDGRELTDPYPGGTTTITWTATDANGNVATCTQTITVNANAADTPAPPTITAPDDLTVYTGADGAVGCGAIVGETELGAAEAHDDGCSVSVKRTGVPAGNLFPVGTTTVTYTATDAAGHTATDTQTVTVIDNTPPVIRAPADAAYTCPTEVPAADASQATGAPSETDPNAPLGPPSDNCGTPTVMVTEISIGSGSAASPRIITRTFTATDSVGNTASAVQTITVTDATPPMIEAPADANYQCASEVPPAQASSATASDNCAGVTVGVTQTDNGGAGSPASPLVITRTFTATDWAGNTASDAQTITVIDNTAPVISCPADLVVYLPLHSSATSMVVNYPAVTATDNCSNAPVTTSQASGTVFPVGTTTVNATATDAAGNSSSCSFNVTVLYVFTGFFSPVDNLPTLNQVNAGKAIPVKFSLSGNKGLNIFAPNNPTSGIIPCGANDPVVDITETVTAGSSSLSYSATNEQYNYVWKTESSWAGTCRQLVMQLNDGSIHRANFKFK